MAILLLAAMAITACNDDDESAWKQYAAWREANTNFYDEQKYLMEGGANVYTTIVPPWNTGADVLIKYLNDRSLTEGNLSPLSTSFVSVKYYGELYDGTPFDSSFTSTDSLFTTQLTNVISGWSVALQYMRVGDSARVVIPYTMGYGASSQGSIPPFSTLVFDIKLVDIPEYEIYP